MKKLRSDSRNNREGMRRGSPVQWAENHKESQNPQDLASLGPGTGFVLDWLAGEVACRQDIQGFPMQFENLAVMNARQANVMTQIGDERAYALRK